MDESAFRAARGVIDPQPCVFEKALLARCADCGLAARHALAEREAIGCGSPVARANCATMLGLLRERCTFALKIGRREGPLPHATSMRLQCGGLGALAHALDAGDAHDVHALVAAAGEPVRRAVGPAVAGNRRRGRRVAGPPSPGGPSVTPDLDRLVDAVRTNCHISDARHARDMTMCTYLLEMRELYRWERGIAFGAPMPQADVGAWMTQREALWSSLEEAAHVPLPLGPSDRRSVRRGARQSRAGRPRARLRRRHRALRQAAVLRGRARTRGTARRRARAGRRARARARPVGGAGRLARRHDLRADGVAAPLALGTRRGVDGQARRRLAARGPRRLRIRGRARRRDRAHGGRRSRDAHPARAGRMRGRARTRSRLGAHAGPPHPTAHRAVRARRARPPGRLPRHAARAAGSRRRAFAALLVREPSGPAADAVSAHHRRLCDAGATARARRRCALRSATARPTGSGSRTRSSRSTRNAQGEAEDAIEALAADPSSVID